YSFIASRRHICLNKIEEVSRGLPTVAAEKAAPTEHGPKRGALQLGAVTGAAIHGVARYTSVRLAGEA
ncbi:MAG TPA: hypothetical protein DD672_05105, partial [Gammaproteobacteria bacterium]|nr:hypothetical protein [Gammaproteobacteria bacterium]